MKLIALKSFRNVATLRLKEDKDGKQVSTIDSALHDDHIHKGAIFSIGADNLKLTAADLHKLAKQDASAANAVSLLVHAECVGDATDTKVVEAVKASVKEDETRESNAKKLDQSAQAQSVVLQLLQAIKGLKPA